MLRENLIRRISYDHPEWGEDRIALELKAKLGVEHASSTIRRSMATRKGNDDPTSTTWPTFLTGHASELWTMDLTTRHLWNYLVSSQIISCHRVFRGVESARTGTSGPRGRKEWSWAFQDPSATFPHRGMRRRTTRGWTDQSTRWDSRNTVSDEPARIQMLGAGTSGEGHNPGFNGFRAPHV